MNREPAKSIGELLPKFVEENHMEDGLQRVRIFNAWEEIIYEIASPILTREEAETITSRKFFADGVLTCKLSSSVYRTQLRFQIEQVRKKLNSRLGAELVSKIVLS